MPEVSEESNSKSLYVYSKAYLMRSSLIVMCSDFTESDNIGYPNLLITQPSMRDKLNPRCHTWRRDSGLDRRWEYEWWWFVCVQLVPLLDFNIDTDNCIGLVSFGFQSEVFSPCIVLLFRWFLACVYSELLDSWVRKGKVDGG